MGGAYTSRFSSMEWELIAKPVTKLPEVLDRDHQLAGTSQTLGLPLSWNNPASWRKNVFGVREIGSDSQAIVSQ